MIRLGIILATLALLILGAWGRSDVLVITRDRGGLIATYVARVAAEKRPVWIEGYCASACTMYLAAKDVCVFPDARLHFHGPSSYGRRLTAADFEYWSRVMADHYPPSLARWFMTRGRYGDHSMQGREVARHGVRMC